MQEAVVVLDVLRERGRKGLPFTQLYRQMFNKELYLLAYGNIYSNQGAMTPGARPRYFVWALSELASGSRGPSRPGRMRLLDGPIPQPGGSPCRCRLSTLAPASKSPPTPTASVSTPGWCCWPSWPTDSA